MSCVFKSWRRSPHGQESAIGSQSYAYTSIQRQRQFSLPFIVALPASITICHTRRRNAAYKYGGGVWPHMQQEQNARRDLQVAVCPSGLAKRHLSDA